MTSPPIVELSDLASARSRLTPGELERSAAFPAEKRRQDWVLGRAAAKQAVREALLRLDLAAPDWQAFEIAASPSGAPRLSPSGLAPTPLGLSLTHGHGRAAAWACPSGSAGGLPGVDLEQIRPRPEGTLRFYLHPAERAWVQELPPGAEGEAGPRDVAAIVTWALKEAAFKALQPPRGTGLLDVEVELEAAHDAQAGTARIAYRGTAAERASRLGVESIRAGWTRAGQLVLAWVEAQGARLPED